MTTVSDQTAAGRTYGALFANIRALSAALLSERRERWLILSQIALKVVADLLVLYSLGEAVATYRTGASPAREMVLFVVAAVVDLTLAAALHTRASRAFTRLAEDLLRQLVHRLQRADLATVERIGMSTIRLRMTADAARLFESGTHFVWFLCEALFAALGLLYFCVYAAEAAVLGAAVLLGSAALVTVSGIRVDRHNRAAEARKEDVLDLSAAVVEGIGQVKIHGPRDRAVAAHFDELVTGYADRQRSYYHAYFAGNALAGALLFGLLGGLVFGYAQLFPGASGDIDRLVVTAFCIFEPVTLIVLDQLQVARGGEALRRMNDLLARLAQVDTTDPIRVDATDPIRVDVTDPIRVDAADPIRVDVTDPIRVDAADPIRVDTTDTPAADPALPHSFSRIELRGVRYAHPLRGEGSGFAIGPIDLTVRPGELVLVTGRNGSGKSTFLRLLTGLYTADQGALVLDGEELSRPVPQRFREHFGVIFSDFVLFDRLYGLADVDPAAVRRLLGDMELDHAVGFAGGAFTTTTELSTGQRKRLAMVVALLDDRPIYVFDEWAADQDPEFRAAFYQRLLPSLVQRGKAVVVASHDDPFFATADRRIHFEAGVPTISGDGRPS